MRPKILIAEDNLINQKLYQAILQKQGYLAAVVGNGKLAVSEIKTKNYDLLIIDCHMPLKDGFAAAAEIRQFKGKKGKVPIIAISGDDHVETKKKCFVLGMNDYLTKPITPSILLATIKRNLAPSSASPYIDKEALKKIEELDETRDLATELIKDFLSKGPDLVESIEKLVRQSKWSDAFKIAHSLKSMAGILGAKKLEAIAKKIELACKEKKKTTVRKIGKLKQIYKKTATILKKLPSFSN